MQEIANIIRAEWRGRPGTKESPETIYVPKHNLEQMTEGETEVVARMLTELGYEHARLVPFRHKVTVGTSGGKQYSGVVIREDKDGIDLEINESQKVTIAKKTIVAITRTEPGTAAFPSSSADGHVTLKTVDGAKYSGVPAALGENDPADCSGIQALLHREFFRLKTDDGRFILISDEHVASITRSDHAKD